MSMKITAEFEAVENAERAARAIRDRVDGIQRLRICPARQNGSAGSQALNIFFPFGIVNQNGIGPPAGLPVIGALENTDEERQGSDFPENQTLEMPRKTTLEVHCEPESVPSVSSLLTSYGGLAIRTQ